MSDAQKERITMTAEVAEALPMPLHHLVDGRAVCDAPEGSVCRLTCAVSCGAEQWPCGGWDDDDEVTSKHDMADSGECHVVLFLASGYDLWETAEDDGERSEGSPPDGDIECEWDGDCYVWRYVDVSSNDRTPGQP